MKDARILFTWETSSKCPAPWRLGLFAVHRQPLGGIANIAGLSDRARRSFQKKTVFLSVRGLLGWSCALAMVAFFAGALVLLNLQQRDPHNRITYSDLVLPWRWSGLNALRGQALIGQAKDRFAAGEIAPGFTLLRLGLARDPAHVQARLDLSQLYLLMRLRSRSDRLLLDAFDHGYPGLRLVVVGAARLSESDNPGLLDRFLEKARASQAAIAGLSAEDARVLDEITLNHWLESGRGPAAVGLAARLYPEGSYERLRVEIQSELEAGDPVKAAKLADAWVRLRSDSEKTLTAVAVAYRKAARYDDMEALFKRLHALAPANANHASLAVVHNLLAGRDAEARAALEDWLFRYGANERALAELIRAISNAGRDDALARIERHVREHGFDPKPVLLGRLLAQIGNRDWDAAAAAGARLRKISRRLTPSDHVIISLVTACVDAGGGNQQVFIDSFARSPGSLDFDRLLLEALLACGRVTTAAQLITLIEGSYPDSQYIARMSAQVADRRRALEQVEEAARPVAKDPAASVFADAEGFLAELHRLEMAGKPAEALGRIRTMRATATVWLRGIEEPLALRELNLAMQAGDLPLLQLTLRNYLRGHPERAQAALDQATRWRKEDRLSEALLAAREILRAWPDFQPALQAVALWDPKLPPSGGVPEPESGAGKP